MMFNPSGALNRIKGAFRTAVKLFTPAFKKVAKDVPNLHEMRLDVDEYDVKRKLGRSFFTRRTTRNSRAARLASLTQEEYLIAKGRGWTR